MGDFIFHQLMRETNPKGSENIWMGETGLMVNRLRLGRKHEYQAPGNREEKSPCSASTCVWVGGIGSETKRNQCGKIEQTGGRKSRLKKSQSGEEGSRIFSESVE
jgi:hypothetical protein